MQTFKFSSIIGILILFNLSCNSKAQSENESTDRKSSQISEESENIESSEAGTQVICLWPKVGLRDKPGKKGTKYLTTIYFGETVEFLNEKKMADDDKEYLKVRLSDGSEGWIYEKLFALGGKLAIIDSETALYKRPDIMTFEGKKLKPMDMIVIFEDENQKGWHEVTSMKQEQKGWIQGNIDAIQNDIDVKLGILYWRAMEESEEKKFELLENILANPNFKESKLIDFVNKALYENDGTEPFYIEELDSFENLSSNNLGITTDLASVKSEPNVNSKVIFQVEKGSICHIIEQGESLQEVNGITDRWYKIDMKGQQGWVFGYFTTKRRD